MGGLPLLGGLCALAGHLLVVFLFLLYTPTPPQEQDASFPISQEGLLLLRRKNEDCSPTMGTLGPTGCPDGIYRMALSVGPSLSLLLWGLWLF